MNILRNLKDQNVIESAIFVVLLALIFLLPVVVSPIALLTLGFTKAFLVIATVVIVFTLFILSVLKKGSVTLPKGSTLPILFSVPIVTLMSALLSGSKQMSLIGYGVEFDTFFFVLILFMLTFLVIQAFSSTKKIFYAYLAFVAAMLLIFIVYGFRFLIGAESLSFGDFNLATSNIFGKWNDLAILSAVVVILSTLLIETVRTTRNMRIGAYLMFFLGLLFLVLVNFFIVWAVLGVLSLISFVYLFSFGRKGEEVRSTPVLSVIVLVVSVVFIISGDQIGQVISTFFNINVVDVRPLWSSTIEVAKQTLSGVKNIVFGSGPNTFAYQWAQFKPNSVNQTVLWNVDFGYGISYLATTLVTVGVIGALSWASFIVFFVYQGFLSLFGKEKKNTFIEYIVISSFVASLFLWIMLLLYIPGIVVITLTFFFTGLFFAALSVSKILPQKEISFTRSPKVGFVITLVLVFVLIGGITLGYTSLQKTLSSIYYQQGLQIINQGGDVLVGGEKVSKAISFAEHDVYYRTLVDINIFLLNQILNTEDLSNSATIGRAQQALGFAIANAQAAIEANPLNYQNYAVLAGVYAAVAPLNVEQSFQRAQEEYQRTIDRAPKNPSIPLALARLEANQGNIDGARSYIEKAISLKNNYTEAIFTLAQIEVAQGNVDEAISSVEVATLLEPNNATLRFQLGLLYYNRGNFEAAAQSFENAIDIVPDYANAKYFLGLSYYELSRRSDAIKEFIDLQISNPENEEVRFILGNLQSGLAPFYEVQPPLDDEPENREELPLEEENL